MLTGGGLLNFLDGELALEVGLEGDRGQEEGDE
jgi:hypothetical protein